MEEATIQELGTKRLKEAIADFELQEFRIINRTGTIWHLLSNRDYFTAGLVWYGKCGFCDAPISYYIQLIVAKLPETIDTTIRSHLTLAKRSFLRQKAKLKASYTPPEKTSLKEPSRCGRCFSFMFGKPRAKKFPKLCIAYRQLRRLLKPKVSADALWDMDEFYQQYLAAGAGPK